jgi:hypothetical protein
MIASAFESAGAIKGGFIHEVMQIPGGGGAGSAGAITTKQDANRCLTPASLSFLTCYRGRIRLGAARSVKLPPEMQFQ